MESNHPPPLNHKVAVSDFSYTEYFRYRLPPAFHVGHANSVPPRLGGPSYQWVNDHHRHTNGMHEAMWRQMEKEKIREEIIAEEIARRHILEAEVRRELMIERDLGMQIRSDQSICMSRLKSINVDPNGFPALVLPPKIDEITLGESSRMSTLVRHEFGNLETSSQTGTKTRTSELMPPSDTVKEKQKANPEAKIPRMKRKAEGSPSVSSSDLTLARAGSKKKVKEELSCALCKVSATSERAHNEHLQGKRHKAKVAKLSENGKNFSIGLFPKKNLMPNKLLKSPSSPCLQKGVNITESEKTVTVIPAKVNSEITKTNNDASILRVRQLHQTVKKNKASDCRTDSRKKRELNFKFWCEMCQVGAFSEKVMETHRKGKKHLACQNTVGEPSTQMMLCKQEMNPTESAEVVEGLGGVADVVELEDRQKDAGKGVEETTTDKVEVEGKKKEACGNDVEDSKFEGSHLVFNEVELESEQKEESITDADNSD